MEPFDHKQTLRQQMIHLLGTGELTLRDLSQSLSVTEKEAMGHLIHLERSLRNHSRKLVGIPHKCLSCGFIFTKRSRFTRPGRCPECKNSHIRTARYFIK